jgi:PAS domain S-box-containing protein
MEGNVLDCNDAWARMLGYNNAGEIRGRRTADFYFNAADREPLLRDLRQEGTFFSREMQLRRKNDTPVWVLFNTVIIADGPDGVPVVQATAIDITERKKAEEALRRREEDYRSFVAQSSEGIFRIELDTPVAVDLPEDELVQNILHHSYMAECNDAMGKMYGFASGEELLGKRLTETLVADDPRKAELTREYIRSGFSVVERESHEVDIQGNPKVFRNSMIGIVDHGKLVRSWGIQRDVTEQIRLENARSRAEKALQVSENHFRLLVEQASDGIFIADAQGRYVDVNSAGAEMLGYTRDEMLQLSITDVVATEDVPRIASEVARFGDGVTIRSEWTFLRKDGSFFPGEVSGKQLPDGRLQGILRDVSERKAAEEAMRRNEERFRVALKGSPITVFNQDRDLRYTWIYNPQTYWQQDAIGKTDAEIIGAKKAASLTELKRRVLKTGVALRQEVMIPHNGGSYAFDITVEPLFDAGGNVIGITGASMDIAQLREMTDRLQDARDRLAHEKSYLEGEIQSELGFEEIIAKSPALLEVLKNVRVVAPTDSTVLLLGDTGTGKELVARSVHSLSSRHDKTFIKLNCAAVPAGLLESELFGHEKGAFTGAVSQKVGRIELADKGTLFLDEIGELPVELQPKLLRVLQDREFERLGGVHTLHVDVRIISATNRDLHKDIANKKFREDLFYRLNVFPIDLRSLRQRRTDIPILVHHFVRKHSARMGKHIDSVPNEKMKVLQNWNWPGNIRELENMIERMVILSKGQTLAAPPVELDAPQEVTNDNLTEMEREHIVRILRETNGVLSGADGAASRLGIKRTTLQSMLKRFGIELQDYRGGNGTFGA